MKFLSQMPRGFGVALTVTCLGLMGWGCSERERIARPETPESLTEAGWSAYEQGDLDDALAAFGAAIAIDPDHGPAYVGQGWARLGRATSSVDFTAALSSLDTAISKGETGAEVRAGRAAILLGRGETANDFLSAASEAGVARGLNPSFVFEHRSSFDSKDLLLIEAFAAAAQASYGPALALADQVQASGIQQGNSSSWVVDGTTFPSFELAVLAYLQKMSTLNAG